MSETSNSVYSIDEVRSMVEESNKSIQQLIETINNEFHSNETEVSAQKISEHREHMFIQVTNLRSTNRSLWKDLDDKEKKISQRKNKYNDKRRDLLALDERKNELKTKIEMARLKKAKVDDLKFISEEDLLTQAPEDFEPNETDMILKRLKFEKKIRLDNTARKEKLNKEKLKLESHLTIGKKAIDDIHGMTNSFGDRCESLLKYLNKHIQ